MTNDSPVLPPGDYIRQEIQNRGWGQADLAQILGRPLPTVNEIIQGKKGIMPDMAVALGTAFGTGAAIWMERESAYRLSLVDPEAPAIQKRAKLFEIAPVKEMQRRGWIKATDSVDKLEQELCNFFDVANLATEPTISAHARQSTDSLALTPAQRAWCYRAKRLAKTIQVATYSEKALKDALPKIRKLTKYADSVKEVSKLLAECGVRLVIVEHLTQTRIDGAAFWLDENSPVVALSIRYDRIDCFWHTLCHELSHILHKDALSVDDALVGETKDRPSAIQEAEARAEKEAASILIPPDKLKSFIIRVKPLYSKVRIIQFANLMEVHPGIVTGQLQHLGEISYSTNREMLCKIRDLATSTALTDGWGKTPPQI